MKAPIFTGSAVAIVTPFTPDGTKVDYAAFERLIDYQIENGTDAIVVCGTTGEAPTLPIPEHYEVVDYCVKYVNHRVPVIAGTGSNDTLHACKTTAEAAKSGADAILVVTPYYNKTTQNGLVKHCQYIADHSPLPMIVYNVPSRTGLGFSLDAYRALAEHPNINGVKEASGDMKLMAELIYHCGDSLNVWSGNDESVLPCLSYGGKGVISVLANVCPRETADMCRFWFEGRVAESTALQIKYTEVISALFCEVSPIPVKAALKLIGLDCGPTRMPLFEMEPAHLKRLENALREVGKL